MSSPLDATPMQLREELAIVWSIVEQEKEFSSRLKKALTEREKQVKMLRDELLWHKEHTYNPFEPDNQCNAHKRICKALAATEL